MDEHVEAIQRMQDYIEAHLDENITMANLANVSLLRLLVYTAVVLIILMLLPQNSFYFKNNFGSPVSIFKPIGHTKKRTINDDSLFLVPLIGLEPIRYCYRGILSPLRLPIPPQRRTFV